MQFATRTAGEGRGATMNLHSGRVIGDADEGYMVGGEKDRQGNRVPTKYISFRAANPMKSLEERTRLQGASGSPEASLGWWRDAGKSAPVESDLSAVYNDRRRASLIGRRRGEKAIWDNKRQREIRLDA